MRKDGIRRRTFVDRHGLKHVTYELPASVVYALGIDRVRELMDQAADENLARTLKKRSLTP